MLSEVVVFPALRSVKLFQFLVMAPGFVFPNQTVLTDVRSLDALRAHVADGAALIILRRSIATICDR